MSLPRVPEPCLCGADDCPRCFPYQNRPSRLEEDEDYAYERWRDEQEDARIAPPKQEDAE